MLQLDGVDILIYLLLGHLIGDFFLQPKAWVMDKNLNKGRSVSLYLHALVHGGITCLVLLFFAGQGVLFSLVIGVLYAGIHGVIDYCKVRLKRRLVWFILDQFLHLVTLVLLWFCLYENAFSQTVGLLAQQSRTELLFIAFAYLLMLKPTSVLIGEMLSKWAAELDKEKNYESLTNAGKYLGYIERVLILTFILHNQFTAVGFILAAKSIFRMGDLREARDRMFTEYIMLGSLFSVSIALFTSLMVNALLK